MGGEPFIEFDLIKNIYDYVTHKQWPVEYRFFASTNGTLVHGKIQEWLRSNKEMFICGLSLDGTPAMHNVNRSNSYSSIDVDFFLECWPNQPVKMTVSPETISYLAEGIIYLHSLGFQVKCNLAYGPDWSRKTTLDQFGNELSKLIDYYVNNENISPCSFLDVDMHEIAHQDNSLYKWCGIGDYMVAYDVFGDAYPCHFFQGMTSDGMHIVDLDSIDFSMIQGGADSTCKQCIIRNVCPTCYGYNYVSKGSFNAKDPFLCDISKISAIASSTLVFRRLTKKYSGLFDKLEDSDAEQMVAIELVQKAAQTGNWLKNG